MSVEYAGYKHFTEGHYKEWLAGGYTEGDLECAVALIGWIEAGFPAVARSAACAPPGSPSWDWVPPPESSNPRTRNLRSRRLPSSPCG